MIEGLPAGKPAKDGLSRDIERLFTGYGDQADFVAARIADACFTAGDKAAGYRWAEIFLIIAERHLDACERWESVLRDRGFTGLEHVHPRC